jgi:hypothetical protein
MKKVSGLSGENETRRLKSIEIQKIVRRRQIKHRGRTRELKWKKL